MMLRSVIYICILLLISQTVYSQTNDPYILVLGTTQDGGFPHLGCQKMPCTKAWEDASLRRNVVSLALVDPKTGDWYLFEATPDIKEQLHLFQQFTEGQYKYLPNAIFITHAHIGHYTGLMQFGKEVMNTNRLPIYVLHKMKKFLETNGPWNQLVKFNNIQLIGLDTAIPVVLPSAFVVRAFTVPHRDEYSETAGFDISTKYRKYLFIPDINKWQLWDKNIIDKVKQVDVAFLDGTFYDSTELPGKRMSEVPHPFITETMDLFRNESDNTRAKIRFIHLNHTNPILWDTATQQRVKREGYNIATQGYYY